MKTKLLSRLNRAITCLNANDSDKTFNEKLMEVRHYARFLNKNHDILKEIFDTTNDFLSKKKHSAKDKEEITILLHSIQKRFPEESCNTLSL